MSQVPACQQAARAGSPARDAVQACLAAARAELREADPAEILLLRTEVPPVAPEVLLERFSEGEGVLRHPPGGVAYAGLGAARVIVGRGPERFAQVRLGQEALWASTRQIGARPEPWEGPRLFGGFAFAADGASSEHWASFGAARFVLPRLTLAVARGRASLTLAIERRELVQSGSAAEQLLCEAHELLSSRPVPATGHAAPLASGPEADPAPFQGRVERLLERIQGGELSKVVAAREVPLSFSVALDPVATVVGLREQAPECLRFLFRTAEAAFLGATPERLLHKRGRWLETEALAGSIDAGADSPERRLQASAKDLEEHALVVSAITSALAPLCERPTLPARPGVRSLKHLLHLCTPIRAQLERDAHVLELVERLHPTPAVGGVPTRAALDWIARTETFDRGWYAGAIGWFDAAGDGDFNVALRSGLVRAERAWLYAGAGIVGGSRAAQEYAETALKLSAMLSSLRARR